MKQFLLFILLLTPVILLAQKNKPLERANEYFEKFDYARAIYFYEIAEEKDPENSEICYKAGMSYRAIGDLSGSTSWFQNAIARNHSNPLCHLYLAEALKSTGNYELAISSYQNYAAKVPSDVRAINHLKDLKYYNKLLQLNKDVEIKNLGADDDEPSFGITAFDNKYIFSAPGEQGTSVKENGIWTEMPYLDLFVAEKSADNELINVEPIESIINTRFHDGPATYHQQKGILYITRNNIVNGKAVRDNTGTVNLKIFEAKRENASWTNIKELPFNSDEYSNAHPCVSYDGNWLYFISNRPGGSGGTDIYRCPLLPDGSWGKPENLGKTINTPGNEMFPYPHSDGTLYFASDGHAGLGGLDIFKSNPLANNLFASPLNPGAPFNSSNDDFGIMYDANASTGFFSTNRSGGIGNDDIYWFNDNSIYPSTIFANINGDISEKNPVKILQYTKGNDTPEIKTLLAPGKVEFDALPGSSIMLLMEYGESLPLTEFSVPTIDTKTTYDLGTYTVPPRFDIAQNPEPELKTEPEKNPVKEEKPEVITPVVKEQPVTEEEVNYTTSELLAEYNLSNIYFDYNKSEIRSDARNTLEQIVKILNDQPSYRLEIRAHTDNRGSVEYNRELSRRRAIAAKEYLLLKGVPEKKIIINWFGATEQIVDQTKATPNGNVKLSQEEIFQLNRRAEFRIIVD
jgi:outer membrane protein OmpA-like peptidoglycan-associated protein/tetratricopeptide (TPR) repeat protein